MRRLRIFKQFLILFTAVFLVCGIVYSVLTIQRMRSYAISVTYDRLEGYMEILAPGNFDEDQDFLNENFEVAWIRGKVTSETTANIITSNNIDFFVTDYTLLVNEIQLGSVTKGHLTSNINKSLYFCSRTSPKGEFEICLTDDSYINSSMLMVIIQSITIFFGVFILAVGVFLLWNRWFIKRIHALQKHINDLDKNNYQVSYIDPGKDEISDLAKSIEEMRLQIQMNEATKRDMLQNVSHDFKTPIAVIKSYAEAIDDGVASSEACELIIAQADKLKKKVNSLLQYNRLAYLEKTKDFEQINMEGIINEVINAYRFRTEIRFETELNEVFFWGYRDNLYTIVDNIVDNALRYAHSLIKITLKDDKLTIYNDGEPIDDKFLNGLFKPYEKGSKGQFGLGMSIVVRTVNFFKLSFKVKNEAVGVSFIITSNHNS